LPSAVTPAPESPRANNFAAMEEDLWAVRHGQTIEKPVYDHSDGTFGAPERFAPKDIVIVHGLFPLYTRALRELFDVAVWLEPEFDLRVLWKVQRDMLQRGYSESAVRAEIEKRRPDAEAYINPQAAFADLNVQFYRRRGNGGQSFDTLSACIRKSGRFKPLDYSEFESANTSIRQMNGMTAGGFPETIIELDGSIDDRTADAVCAKIWSHMGMPLHAFPARLGEYRDGRGANHTGHALALAQLLIARRIVLVENELLEGVPS
jgi:phosphoribulokinase